MFEKFPLLAWPVGEFNERQIEEVKLWKEIGLTCNLTSRWDEKKHSKEALIRLLDECRKYDIKIIIQDTRLLWNGASSDPDAYRERYRAAYKDFGKHPATLGFYIGDEPMEKNFNDVITAFRIQKEEAPELLPFLNLLPIWKGSTPPYMGFETLENYISRMKAEYNAPVLSYDRYTQMAHCDDGVDDYFRDLQIYNDIAQTLGIPMWTCLLTIGHWNYKVPTEEEVRWQLNTALAGGCTGIIWFTLNDIPFSTNAHGAAIDMFGEKTQYFYNIKTVAKYFLASHAEIFKDLKLDATYHVGHSFGGVQLFEKGCSDIVLNVESLKGVDMIISFFTPKNGDKYLAVVSNSKTANNNNFNLTFNTKTCDPYEIREFGKSVRVFDKYPNRITHDFDPRAGSDEGAAERIGYTINTWAAAGQMYLFKL